MMCVEYLFSVTLKSILSFFTYAHTLTNRYLLIHIYLNTHTRTRHTLAISTFSCYHEGTLSKWNTLGYIYSLVQGISVYPKYENLPNGRLFHTIQTIYLEEKNYHHQSWRMFREQTTHRFFCGFIKGCKLLCSGLTWMPWLLTRTNRVDYISGNQLLYNWDAWVRRPTCVLLVLQTGNCAARLIHTIVGK